MIPASDTVVGKTYKTPNGILVEVVEKKSTAVVVKSFETGHNVPVGLTYQLEPVIEAELVEPEPEPDMEENEMSEQTTVTPTATATKTRKVKKSNIVDEGLKAGLSVDEIVKNVLASFPEAQDKSIRNLVSVRRSKLKNPTA